MKRLLFIFVLAVLLPMLASGQNPNLKCPAVNVPILTGDETVNAPVAPAIPEIPAVDETDLIGDTTTLGMTWYENQHNGTCGRMNTLEPDGWRQFVWMKGENSGATLRHIWWNGIDPNGLQVYTGTGVAVDAGQNAGFPTMDVKSNGAGCIIYHTASGLFLASDLLPHTGAFLGTQLPVAPYPVYWPQLQINQNQVLQVIATSQVSSAGRPQRQYCFNSNSLTWTFVDWTQTIAADVATSPVTGSNKTLWAWTRSMSYPPMGEPDPNLTYSQLNNDVYYLIDSDGLNPNFSQKVNLTNFIPPDLALLPDTLRADMDTLRAYTCLSAFIDHNNYAHIAFTTRAYFQIEQTSYWNASMIWHWSEQYPDSFRVVGSTAYFNPNDSVYCGAWNVKAQRPSLGEDASGNLYCMYQVYDTDLAHISAAGYPSGEVYISVSTDGGLNWSQGTNVTSTITPGQAPPGQCQSELTPTLAKKVDNYCHIEYVYDLDAGNVIQSEGSWTNNPVRYHRVSVSQIPTAPLVVQNKHLHVSVPPQLDVTLTPVTFPPPPPGIIQFNLSVLNNGPSQTPFCVWVRVKFPNGTYTNPILGPVHINPPIGQTVTRLRMHTIPATWPPGVYADLAYVNWTYSYPAVDSSWFTWTKLAGGVELGSFEPATYCQGEPFPGEIMPVSTQPSAFKLMDASPNPFNATTAISYELRAASLVSLKVYDSAGRLVTTLVEGWRGAGDHEVTFDGANLASGVYLYKLKAGEAQAEGKIVLLK